MLQFPQKHPDEVLDYKIDWSRVLDGDTTATSATEVGGSGLLLMSQSHDDSSSTAWLKAGVAGSEYELTCIITTIGGRTIEQVATLPIAGA